MRQLLRQAPALLAGLALLACALVGATSQASRPGTGSTGHDLRLAFGPDCTGYCQYPTNAAKVFRWGAPAWGDEFELATLNKRWKSNHPAQMDVRLGMLEIWGDGGSDVVNVWPDDQKAAYGRWEARVRGVDKSATGDEYQLNWELVPTGRYHCGARSIVLSSYHLGDRAARGAVRTLPDHQFSYSRRISTLGSGNWHTYAIEVTRTHISWFVDTKVVRTERRPAALSGVTFRPRFRVVGVPGATMKKSAMQMDWVRYYTLKRPNAQSIAAPRMTRGTYPDAC